MEPDPLHDDRPNQVTWSRANMAEAIPGLAMPLSWTFWRHGFEHANATIWHRLGALSKAESQRPQGVRPEWDYVSVVYGRPVVNVDALVDLFSRVPGGDPAAIELQLLGSAREGVHGRASRRRWPFLAARAPLQLAGLDRRIARMRAATHTWWRTMADPTRYPSTAAASAGLADALARFDAVQELHGLALLVGQVAFEQLSRTCRAAGRPELVLDLAASGTAIDEAAIVDDLWQAASGRLTVAEVAARHGFHGPDEGNLHGRSWREDPAPLAALVARYREQGAPLPRSSASRRAVAEAALSTGRSPAGRWRVQQVLRFADRALPRREVTKSAFLQAIDVGRAAARALGSHLATAGLLGDPEDVFLLTFTEATASPPRVSREAIADRARRREAYAALEVPAHFVGTPPPGPAHRPAEPVTRARSVTGVGGSPGVAEGVARVITSPFEVDRLAPGEVLVCHTTDPGWVPFFEIASAVVIDLGGPLSHGAIVAREMAVPCVIGTEVGTARIADGDRVRVDGNAGRVEWIDDRAP